MGRSLTNAAVFGWPGLAFLLFLLQGLPYLSHRWVADESWYAGPAYSIAHGNGAADPAIGPNDWILTAPIGRAGFREEYLNRAGGGPLWTRFLQEGHRYPDLLGLNILHGHGLESIPVRLPIPLFFLAASFFLGKLRRHWFYLDLELLLLTPAVFWLIYTVTRVRAISRCLRRFFSLTIGAAVATTSANRKLHCVVQHGMGLFSWIAGDLLKLYVCPRQLGTIRDID